MIYKACISKRVLKYLKKLKDKKLQQKIVDVIYLEIEQNPYQGALKTGDLLGVYSWKFKYANNEFRIAYTIEYDLIIPILLAESRENFYQELKRIVK